MPDRAFNTVHVRAAAGRSRELGERLRQIAELVRATPDCLDYAVQRSPVDPDLWTVNGCWAGAEPLNAHFGLPALQGFIELASANLASRLAFDH
ncbi:MAG TPA: monooxygenase [Pseudomonas sp.]|uniref:putative quinol monooxygenase n=1 Tax=unclassified Pseudomonas TaxID=196821 RepID=UPI00047FC24D|nr:MULTISPECIES: antibiotic biosynthesis monooxygenase [unclassified Pseudomonas]SME91198.1 Quinol monooxygenase YgiN [Pseudomonas sp. LAMO17WK12:I1]HAA40121.1 monooxygenase [Pseudomonas sp.]